MSTDKSNVVSARVSKIYIGP